MNVDYDAIVLGAGIAGSSAAAILAARGWNTLLLDRNSFPRHKVCGEFLSPESRMTLQEMGLWKTVEALAPERIEQARICLAESRILDIPLPGAAYGISRYTLDYTLHQVAEQAGVHIITNALVTNVVQNEQAYIIETRQQKKRQTYRAKVVIAAWGAYHRTNESRSESRTGKTWIGVKSHYALAADERVSSVELYFFPGGYLGLSPIEDGLVNAAALVSRPFSQQAKSSSVLGLLEAAVQSNRNLARRFHDAVPLTGTQAAIAPIHLQRKPVIWGKFPHIGDSAVMVPPLCGDGMSIALYTANNCSILADRYLRHDISLAEWRDAYIRSIRKAVRNPVFWGRIMQHLTGMPILPHIAHTIGKWSPRLTLRLVRATRLAENVGKEQV